MKSLVNGCAAAALLMGLGFPAYAEIAVRDAPVHAAPADADDDTPAAEAPPAAAKAEPASVGALIQAKAAPSASLTPEENAFFGVLGRRVTDAASAYESYVRRAGGIDPAFSGAAAVQHAVQSGAAYMPQQLEEGVIAYAALIALRNPAFVDGVRAVQNPAFADSLAASPERVMQVRGAAEAAADAAGVLQAQGAALTAAGKAVTKAAYDIQSQSWSKTPVADPRGVLDAVKASANEARAASVPSKEKLLASLVSAPRAAQAAGAPAPDVVRGLALAALAVLGKTGDGTEAQYEALLHDVSSEDCLKIAKLNLNQCLAAAGPQYEDAYCAGLHGVSDTGKCVSAAAASTGAAPDVALPAPAPRLQEAEAIGPEQAEAYGKVASKMADDDDANAVQPDPAPRSYAAAPPAEPARDPRTGPEAAQAYAQNDYAPSQPPPAQYSAQPYPQPGYAQPQYQPSPYQQAYAQAPYPPQPYPAPYPSAPYAQQPPYAPAYGAQPYYPQGYYGR